MTKRCGTFQIGDISFDTVDATLSAQLTGNDPILWSIEIKAGSREIDDELSCQPKAYLEHYPSAARSLDELIAKPIVIDDSESFCGGTILPGAPLCCLYAFEHNYFDHTRIELHKIAPNDMQRLRIRWTGEAYAIDGQAKVTIDSNLVFLGFSVTARDETDAWKSLESRFNPTGLRFHREADDRMYFLPTPPKDRPS